MRCKLITCTAGIVISLLAACDDTGKEEPAGTLTSPDGNYTFWATYENNGINNSVINGYLTKGKNKPGYYDNFFSTSDCEGAYVTWRSNSELVIYYDRIYVFRFSSLKRNIGVKSYLIDKNDLPQNITSNGNVLKLPCTVWK